MKTCNLIDCSVLLIDDKDGTIFEPENRCCIDCKGNSDCQDKCGFDLNKNCEYMTEGKE